MTELPICAAILAAETGLSESKAVYLSRVCEAVYAAKEEKKA